ncbi:MAG: hypothetical protein KC931_13645, partial [Candidatus Omnitrophica bacterium]|nr:hypothetical protein [Candidatus Omnitrophota bacterium]
MSAIAVVALLVIGALGYGLLQANREREKLQRQIYYSDIKKAYDANSSCDFALAREILYKCTEKFRGMEWGLEAFRANRDMASYRG